ncbi:imidazole glycerol phosphate synthase subunit HisH [Geomonas sp. Red69]|uniref:Imidazole glycerol phosphate synthase subunit HisH n=1 Tax=Geomonas diazotrophica TaxID=2843197 RepID=A0ABX8JFQ9_9BACT|nr:MULTISPECIES: imidazole glycerol phosphate synthase subunit HisH [Geomonas]MBU5636079.1 imidazole glycerol phosphate synthase subunit HisH [Geomonas diazotrophica]QWV95981.1 imidazole glycerol phosphate synthase subunit HisH [Geomonas nitrogeniifigens]QXE85048.1 imidazole glycerol phosphate synthase subunit HisH [Geomonas nitrogeniifigens]
MITIVDYGMGNLGSIRNMFKRIGAAAVITGDLEQIARAEKILLPGVGAFDNAMLRIDESGLREVLDQKALVERVPVLGICLGMQLLTRSSEEGSRPGLGWVAAQTKRFPALPGLKVPHMGWNLVELTRDSALTGGLAGEVRFYFVHSYYVCVDDEKDQILKAHYGLDFTAALQHDNIYGAQFHPEKSHRFGMQLLKNFASL